MKSKIQSLGCKALALTPVLLAASCSSGGSSGSINLSPLSDSFRFVGICLVLCAVVIGICYILG